jgi:hypothetical protein
MTYSNDEIYEMFQEEDPKVTIVEDGDWLDEGKRSFRYSYIRIADKFYQIEECRSGSYFTDYYYDDPEIYEVTPRTETVIKTFWDRVK